MDITKLDAEVTKKAKKEVAAKKAAEAFQEFEDIAGNLDEKARRLLKCAQEAGASVWLAALPLKKMGYAINKQEFRDAICLRYGWEIRDMPTYCGCGSENSVDHVLVCKVGGYVSMRHNALRDVEASLLEKVCSDVRVEPVLLKTNAPDARLDISARGVWSKCEKTFFDVKVMHPTAESHVRKDLAKLYSEGEAEKKRKYGDRIIHVEKASLTPLVFTTTGGMGPECTRLNKRIAELICNKTGERYSHVMGHIRLRLRFALLRATVVVVQGVQGQRGQGEETDLYEISFNLIPKIQKM